MEGLDMSSSDLSTQDSAQERVSRVTDMLMDVEEQIKQYILEQRVREEQAQLDAAQWSNPETPSSLPHSPLSLSKRTSTQRQASLDTDIPLDLIFDSPETQVSPSRSPRCELGRRGATFHRVDSLTAEADDRRSQQWTRMSNPADPSIESNRSPSPTASSSSEMSRARSSLATDGGIRTANTSVTALPNPSGPSGPPSSSHSQTSDAGPPAPPPNKDFGQEIRLDRRRSSSLAQIEPIFIPPAPFSSTTLRVKSAFSPETPSDSGFLSSRASRTPWAYRQSHTNSSRVAPTKKQDSEDKSSLFLEDGSIRKSILTDRSDWLDSALQLGNSLDSSAPKLYPRGFKATAENIHRPSDESRQSDQKDSRWWQQRKQTASLVQDSDKAICREPSGEKGKRTLQRKPAGPTQRKKRHQSKRWNVGEGMTELLSGRMFQRMEVAEIIDTRAIKHFSVPASSKVQDRPLTPSPGPLTRSTEPSTRSPGLIERPLPPTPDEDVQHEYATKPMPTLPPLSQHPTYRSLSGRRQREKGTGKVASQSRGDVAQAPPTDNIITPRSRRNTPSRRTSPLSPVLEVSSVHGQESESSPTQAPTSSPSATHSRPSLPKLPTPVMPPPMSPSFLHGPIRLSVPMEPTEPTKREVQLCTSSADDLDWTAFQMAISGPTGDYFMGGETSPESADDDEIVEWFASYGFDSEGSLIHEDDATRAAASEPVWLPPVELPALDSVVSSVRSSGVTLASEEQNLANPDPVAEESEVGKMSCNLNDLGDYLNFESSHVGSLDDGRYQD